MVNSGEYDGMDADACKSKIITDLETKEVGKGAVNYKLRDWIFFAPALLGRTNTVGLGIHWTITKRQRQQMEF